MNTQLVNLACYNNQLTSPALSTEPKPLLPALRSQFTDQPGSVCEHRTGRPPLLRQPTRHARSANQYRAYPIKLSVESTQQPQPAFNQYLVECPVRW